MSEVRDHRRHYPSSGQMVDLPGRTPRSRIHVDSRGRGVPPVVLEAGLAATSLSWALVQDDLAREAQTVSYDRAGLGWSSKASGKMSVASLVRDFADLIDVQFGAQQTVLLVGHSFGGLLVRAYAAQYPERVAGLVLVDPVSIEHWAGCGESERRRLALGAKLARRGALLAHFGIVRLCLAALVSGRKTLPRLIARTSGGKGTNLVNRLVGEMSRLPSSLWPAVSAHWSRPGSFRVMADYLESLPESARTVHGKEISCEIPLTILSAETATAAELQERERWVQSSRSGNHIRVSNCSHWIQLQRPTVVIRAVVDMLEVPRSFTR